MQYQQRVGFTQKVTGTTERFKQEHDVVIFAFCKDTGQAIENR